MEIKLVLVIICLMWVVLGLIGTIIIRECKDWPIVDLPDIVEYADGFAAYVLGIAFGLFSLIVAIMVPYNNGSRHTRKR